MIKIFIGYFSWLPYNPDVSAWDLAQVGEGGVMVLREVDAGLGGQVGRNPEPRLQFSPPLCPTGTQRRRPGRRSGLSGRC